MTCGDVYREVVAEVQRGDKYSKIAQRHRISTGYVGKIMNIYKRKGDKCFESKRPFQGTPTIPDEAALFRNHQADEWKNQKAARELAELRASLAPGDKVMVVIEEGRGFVKKTIRKEIEVVYVGKDYVFGKSEKGVPETVMLHDLWKTMKNDAILPFDGGGKG